MKKIIAGLGIIILTVCCKGNNVIKISNTNYELAFSDEFDEQSLKTDIWDYRTDSKHWSTQKKENVEVKDGFLYLNLKKEKSLDKEYTGAGLISKKKFKYGYYEARLKTPFGGGWHTSFWLMTHDGSGGTNTNVATIEIDILENDSKDRKGYHVNLHKWYDGHKDYIGKHVEAFGIDEKFQVLACEYTPEYVRYYLNGEVVREINIKDLNHSGLNIWLTSIASFLGGTESVDDTKLPSSAIFDYVRYYKPVK
ncbi:glycoside hydrolase family 16 protein [Seonamhaeicola sp.]|uniref:glycoside hydrolase family 16 protein n=1 Tax=Seonamhaeicola sp. TaxID=1912245 RepID=UPI002627FBFB|nr:glycoside hydrolase family 16 protein [Seonamhaeicola sp.]